MEEAQATVDDQAMTESLVYSGMESLAESDNSLTQDEETKLLEVTKGKLPKKETPGSKIGKRLAGMADEIDSIFASDCNLNDLLPKLKDKDPSAWNELKQYLMNALEQIVRPDKGITEGCIFVIILLGYSLIRRYLKLLLGENILTFIEKITNFIYEVFKKYGILKWILIIGGWPVLAARRMDISIFSAICSVIPPRGIWGILGVGAAAITGFCAYKAIS